MKNIRKKKGDCSNIYKRMLMHNVNHKHNYRIYMIKYKNKNTRSLYKKFYNQF